MKRHFNLLASVLLVIAMVFALASCDLIDKIIPGKDQPEPEHQHAFVDGSCECGEADPNYVAPHTHNFVEGKCECGETDPNYTKPECAEHAYGAPEVTKEATCTESGSKTLTCTVCGYATELEIAPNGHTEEDIPGKAATCTEAGLSTGSKCTVCGVVTEEQIAINPKGHSFVEGSCTVCGVADPEYNGPKTYSFHFSDVVTGADKDAIAAGTTYANGYFTIVGTVTQRVKDGAVYCVEVAKNGTGAIQFTVIGTATVEVQFSSTGGSNTSKIGLFDADGNLVANNEGITEVTGASAGMTVVTYNLTAGTYSVVSPASNVDAGETDYNRGARVFYVNVTETPTEEVEVPEIKVETTDTYGWFDEYSFTADAEGYYTFTLPAGLGFCSKAKHDSFSAPELDFYDNAEGATVVVGLEAGEELVFYVGALTKDTWTITWSFEAGEVENGSQGGDVSGVTELVVGSNNVVFADGELSMGKEFSFTVTEEGTYTFRGDLMAAVMDAEGNSMGRGQVYLTPGTYTVALFSMMPMPSNSFVINITFEAPATGEPNGSEQFPYIWETLPESVTFESDNMNMVYYVFTATADGSVTFTWAVEGNDWFNYFELVDGATTDNNASGFAKTSHTFVVEAGKTYRVGLGTWNEGGETVVSIAFNACAHVWSEATCTAPSTCANCGATTGDKAEHTSTVAEPTCSNPDVCGVCGVELSYVDHAWDDGVVITPADCATETDGVKLLTCTVCGATQEETIWGYHTMDETYNYPTCTVDGSYHGVCTVCGYEESNVIEAQGHYNYFLSCGDSGECMECGETFTLEHDFSWSPATCTEPAYCGNCWQYIGEALGHDYDHIPHDATCTAGGYTEHICALCDYTYTDGETEALGHADEDANLKCDVCSATLVPADGIYTIPQVLASAEGTQVIVKGMVSEIYQAWSDQYKNISFYIVDEAGNRLLIFRTGTMANIGDQVTVTGKATVYENVIQIAQGGKTVIDVAHVCSDFIAADCLNAAICKICDKANGEALGHSYVNGTCERCNATETVSAVTVSKTMKELITELGWTSSTTKQSFTLDDNVSVKINGGSNTGKAYNGDHIRIYATDSPAGTITISVPQGYELVSVKVSTQTGTYAYLYVNGTTTDICNKTVEVSGSSVVLNSVKNGSDGKQVRVTAIEVTYKPV